MSTTLGEALITGIDIRESFRGFSEGFGSRPERAPMTAETIIYGHNGSGKSTLSAFLEALGTTGSPTKCQIRTLDTTFDLKRGDKLPGVDIIVFNNSYIDRNLVTFLEGTGTSTLTFALGEASIHNQERRSIIESHLARNEAWASSVRSSIQDTNSESTDLLTSVKSEVIKYLSDFDPAEYNTTRFTVQKARQLLESTHGSVLTDEALEKASKTLNDKASIVLNIPPLILTPLEDLLKPLNDLLGFLPEDSTTFDTANNAKLADWLRAGVNLHTDGKDCLFCGNSLTSDRLLRITEALSDKNETVRTQIELLAAAIRNQQGALRFWMDDLPPVTSLASEVQQDYNQALESLRASVALESRFYENVAQHLDAKSTNMSATINWSYAPLPKPVSTTEIVGILDRHNTAVLSTDARKISAISEIKGHIEASFRDRIESSKRRSERLNILSGRLSAAIRDDKFRLDQINAEEGDTSAFAAHISTDLRSIFGKGALSVVESPNGDGYMALRDGEAATHLSEGERKIIALCYFLRSLHSRSIIPEHTTVVIDDPVTSLDRENMFATASWIAQESRRVNQLILLTHNYEFFHLQRRMLERFDSTDSGISALELVNDRDGFDEAATGPKLLPNVLLTSSKSSEYHLLFSTVCEAVLNQASSPHLTIVGNSARRLIEGFLAFKAPQVVSFGDRLSVASPSEIPPETIMRLKHFLHHHSHRSAPDPTEIGVFPTRTLRSDLKLALIYIRMADPEHFSRMCTSVGVDEKPLFSGKEIAIFQRQIKDKRTGLPLNTFGLAEDSAEQSAPSKR